MSPVSLAAWLEPLPDAAAQRELDAWAIQERGIPGVELMERAGGGLARTCAQVVPDGRIAAVCGKGNNGGDGLVAARLLREQGREVDVLLLGDPDELRGDARTNLQRLPGASPIAFSPDALVSAAGIIDAILGTGFSGTPREPAAGAIDAINRARDAGGRVIACDVPSGVDASTGEVLGAVVQADATVTFHAGKPGLWIAPGKAHAGEVSVLDIGIPSDGAPLTAQIGLITSGVLAIIPRRGADATKFSAGSVLVCGGSTGLAGAPTMAALAAARAGAGYVTAAVPASLVAILAAKLLEVMQVGLPESDGALTPPAADVVLERAERVQCLVLGPGLGRAAESLDFARQVARAAEVPLVLDADGLGAHAGRLEDLRVRPAATVLTPHAGELARLLELDSAEIGARRLACARRAAERSGAIVVLKGDDTIIAEPEGRVAVNRADAPALATAGTGDVLSGVLAAHLAKGLHPFDAACAAVFVHAAAGRLAGREIGSEGALAGDVIDLLPRVLAPSEV